MCGSVENGLREWILEGGAEIKWHGRFLEVAAPHRLVLS